MFRGLCISLWLSRSGRVPPVARPSRSDAGAGRVDPKDMVHAGSKGMAGWVRNDVDSIHSSGAGEYREQFISEIIDRYLGSYRLMPTVMAHVKMVRLEVEACGRCDLSAARSRAGHAAGRGRGRPTRAVSAGTSAGARPRSHRGQPWRDSCANAG